MIQKRRFVQWNDKKIEQSIVIDKNKNRIEWLDQCKGLAIILTVFSHCWSREINIYCWISSFHMSLFFIVAGYMIALKNPCFNKKIITRKVKRLLVPYFVFSFTLIGMIYFLRVLGGNKEWTWYIEATKKIICFDANSPTWFLPCLFFSECLFVMFLNKARRKKIFHIILLGGCLIGALGINWDYSSIIVIKRVFLAIAWLEFGFILYYIFEKKQKDSKWLALLAISSNIFLSNLNGISDMMTMNLGRNIVIYIISGLMGSVAIMIILKNIHIKMYVLKFYGLHSLEVLCTHALLIVILRLLDYKLLGDFIRSLFFFEGYILTIIVLLLEIPIVLIINKYACFLIGKSQN